MVAFADLIKLPTLAQIKALVITGATNLGLPVTSWVPGDPSERWMEIIPRGIDGLWRETSSDAEAMSMLRSISAPELARNTIEQNRSFRLIFMPPCAISGTT